MSEKTLDLSDLEKFQLAHKRSGKLSSKFCKDFRGVVTKQRPVPGYYAHCDLGELTLGEIAYVLRLRSGLTMRQLGFRLMCSPTSINNWEKGHRGSPMKQISYLMSLKPHPQLSEKEQRRVINAIHRYSNLQEGWDHLR